MKREGNLFDVTMGTYDGAEVCELVGIFKVQSKQEDKTKRNRKWNIIWFNPLYSTNVATKVGHYFLQLYKEKSFVH